jgi:hydroxymethylbilane synthase
MSLHLGTRASALARWQADWVAAQLRKLGVEVELTPITTSGDRTVESLETFGGQGVFTKEIQLALLDGRIDVAVHSLKDLPTVATPGLCLAAVPERASCRDVLVSASGKTLENLPKGAVIGTGSPRRRAQLLHVRPDLQMNDIRGNLDTRLRKLQAGDCNAIVLAEAGLQRLGFADRISQVLPLEIMLPAASQGALGLETRADDESSRRIVAQLDHAATHAAVSAERSLLASLRAGCLAPVAALAQMEDDRLTLIGRVVGIDGAGRLEASRTASLAEAHNLGRRVAEDLSAQGADALIRDSRQGFY